MRDMNIVEWKSEWHPGQISEPIFCSNILAANLNCANSPPN